MLDLVHIFEGFWHLVGFLWRNRLKVVLGLITVGVVAWLTQLFLGYFGWGEGNYWAIFFTELLLAILLSTIFWVLRTLVSMVVGLFRPR